LIGHQAQRRIKKFTTREHEKTEEVKGQEVKGLVEDEGEIEVEIREKKRKQKTE